MNGKSGDYTGIRQPVINILGNATLAVLVDEDELCVDSVIRKIEVLYRDELDTPAVMVAIDLLVVPGRL